MAILSPLTALLLAIPAFAATSSISSVSGGEKVACAKLKLTHSEQTFFPGSTGYTYETQSGKSRLQDT